MAPAKTTTKVKEKARTTAKATNATNKAYWIEQKGLVVASVARARGGAPGPAAPGPKGARAPDAATNPFCSIP